MLTVRCTPDYKLSLTPSNIQSVLSSQRMDKRLHQQLSSSQSSGDFQGMFSYYTKVFFFTAVVGRNYMLFTSHFRVNTQVVRLSGETDILEVKSEHTHLAKSLGLAPLSSCFHLLLQRMIQKVMDGF